MNLPAFIFEMSPPPLRRSLSDDPKNMQNIDDDDELDEQDLKRMINMFRADPFASTSRFRSTGSLTGRNIEWQLEPPRSQPQPNTEAATRESSFSPLRPSSALVSIPLHPLSRSPSSQFYTHRPFLPPLRTQMSPSVSPVSPSFPNLTPSPPLSSISSPHQSRSSVSPLTPFPTPLYYSSRSGIPQSAHSHVNQLPPTFPTTSGLVGRRESPPEQDYGARGLHRCTVCDKGFPRPSALTTHMNVHTGMRRALLSFSAYQTRSLNVIS